MLDVLTDGHFQRHYASGFVESGLALPADLVEEIRAHYRTKATGHNDFPKFFVNNEHQAYVEGRLLGTLLNAFPGTGRKLVKKFYDRAYSKAVYCEQAFIRPVLEHLLDNGFQRLFKTRYLVAGYDMYLRNGHRSPAAGIHTDLPNFHHFYETENDLSLYIPLVDLDDTNGGRITVLPEAKLKVAGNVLLKLLYEHFSKDPACLDARGWIDPDRIAPQAVVAFARGKAHQELMSFYKGVIALAKHQYAADFRRTDERAGQVVIFSNKNFHAAEQWRNEALDREVYVIRMFPLYDARIRLKSRLHGTLVNNFLLDMHEGTVEVFDHPVDLAEIPEGALLRL